MRSPLHVVLRSAAGCALGLLACAALPGWTAEPAGQPGGISWKPFEPATLEKARSDGKLILLSIQTPFGHWDRLMSELTYTDPRVITLLNQRFVPVRVDPLLRPDIQARYAVGGWPSTVFLLGSGQPFYFPDASRKTVRAGGNYYAPEALTAYLYQISEYFAQNKEPAQKAADEIAQKLIERKEISKAPLTPDILEVTVTKMLEAYRDRSGDPQEKVARHPDVDSIELGFHYYARKKSRGVLDVSLGLLTDMARGGIRDQIGGGFHRFAADAAWRVPVFEKTLMVNAEMLQAYVDAFKVTGNGVYVPIAEDVARYVTSTLGTPEGWFCGYQAADAKLGEDGDYYTWTLDEAKAVLSKEEQDVLLPAYDIGEWGDLINSAPRRNVLFVAEGPIVLAERLGMDQAKVKELLESGRRKLLDARSRREAPPVGRILLTDANAEMALALIQAGDAWLRPPLRDAGLKALDALREKMDDKESHLFAHAWTPEKGRLEGGALFTDQVQMVRALLAAHESTGEGKYLDVARQTAEAAGKAFKDSLNGGYTDRIFDAGAPGLLSWPRRDIRDNALFAESLVRLRYLTGEAETGPLVKTAREALESWAGEFTNYKEAGSAFGLAVDRLLSPPLEVILTGDPADPGYEKVRAQACALYHPWKVTRRIAGSEVQRDFGARGRTAPAGSSDAPQACTYLCQADRCAGPFSGSDNLHAKLDEFLNPGAKPAQTPAKDPS